MSDLICGRIAPYLGINPTTCRSVLWGSPSDQTAIGCGDTHSSDGDADVDGDMDIDVVVDADRDETGPVDGDEADAVDADRDTEETHLCQPLSFEGGAFFTTFTGGIVDYPIVANLDNDATDEVLTYDYGAPWWSIDTLQIFAFGYNATERNINQRWSRIFGHQGEFSLSPNFLVGNLDERSSKEILAFASAEPIGQLMALTHDGSDLEGWPIEFGTYRHEDQYLALRDLNRDRTLEIVVSELDRLSVLDNNGTFMPGWPQELPYQYGGYFLAIGDYNNDGRSEIITSSDNAISVYSHEGTLLREYPVARGLAETEIVLGDVNNDGSLEVISLEEDASSRVINIRNYDHGIISSWNVPESDSQGFSQRINAIGDIDGDEDLEILYGRALWSSCMVNFPYLEGALDIYHHDGTHHLTGWPITPPDETQIFYNPVIADINGDERMEIIIGAGRGEIDLSQVLFYNSDGILLDRLVLPGESMGIDVLLAVGDINGDGKIDIVTTGYRNSEGSVMSAWNCTGTYDPSNIEWGMYGHDPYGSWNYETPIER